MITFNYVTEDCEEVKVHIEKELHEMNEEERLERLNALHSLYPELY